MNYEKKEPTYEQTKEKALRLLEFRNHTKKELERKLKVFGANEENIEKVTVFLQEYGLINDREYAKRFACDLQNLKKYGKNRIKNELFAKGISPEFVDEAIGELDDDYEDTLKELIKKRLKGDFEQKNKDRTIRYFIYRGYSFDEIKRIIAELENEQN